MIIVWSAVVNRGNVGKVAEFERPGVFKVVQTG